MALSGNIRFAKQSVSKSCRLDHAGRICRIRHESEVNLRLLKWIGASKLDEAARIGCIECAAHQDEVRSERCTAHPADCIRKKIAIRANRRTERGPQASYRETPHVGCGTFAMLRPIANIQANAVPHGIAC